MKILQFCSKPPLPSTDGGSLASYHLSLEIDAANNDLALLSIATVKHPFEENSINKSVYSGRRTEFVTIDTEITPLKALVNLFSGSSIQSDRFVKVEVEKKLRVLIDEFKPEVIVLDDIRSAFYLDFLRKTTSAKLLYRSVNIEWLLFKERAELSRSLTKKAYLAIQAQRLRRLEDRIWKSVDMVLSISNFDIEVAKELNWETRNAHFHPFSLPDVGITMSPQPNTFFHLGSMDWEANIEGIRWFCREIWPSFLEKNADAQLHLGGRSIGELEDLKALKGIVIHPTVENADVFASQYEILIVPLRSGSGNRIKILQAMARGNIVVSTPKGIEGIPAKESLDYLQFTDQRSFNKNIEDLINNQERKALIRDNAKRFISNNYGIAQNASRLSALMTKLLGHG
ncbi:MAG: glycosyltransferase family 4 protein [Vicingaceae bacterium]